MDLTIDLDSKARIRTIKVEDEWPDWMLSAKSVTRDLTSTQLLPQQHFRERHGLSKRAGSLHDL